MRCWPYFRAATLACVPPLSPTGLATPVRVASNLSARQVREDDSLSFFFSSRRRHTRSLCDWSSDVCSSDLTDADTNTGDDANTDTDAGNDANTDAGNDANSGKDAGNDTDSVIGWSHSRIDIPCRRRL